MSLTRTASAGSDDDDPPRCCSPAACQIWCDRSSRAARAFICTFVFTCTVVSALVILGCLVVKPYMLSKDFRPTECMNLNVTWWERWCCLRALVQYYDDQGVSHFAYIIEDEYSLLDGHHAACSYVSCMDNMVNAWKLKHGVLLTRFACHFNPYNYKQVMRRKRYNEKMLLHSLLWPTGVIVIGVIVMVVLVRVAKLNVRGDIYHPDIEERELYFRQSIETNNPISRVTCNPLDRHSSLPVTRASINRQTRHSESQPARKKKLSFAGLPSRYSSRT
ncbi:PREDICTED: uncharacterized protein LOC106808658 [Priapulus caudatus]|uniref:Uncharacterized protein LOC106808658 n=1 Tax=Priapulus caudatus TaxID=37621 RepID=A0ABM1E432_PRICU|nr:PREDICTED: uncharacterized protein LOC106808658 [Priapulus caudatus]